MNWFNSKRDYKVVEVEKPRNYTTLEGDELRQSLHSLLAHPGFLYLRDRLRSQRALLQGRLEEQRPQRLEDVTFLQQGLFWTRWLSAEVDRLTQAPQKPVLDPVEQELQAFRELDNMLTRVGQ